MHCLTFDLEDWFHFLDPGIALDVEDWVSRESHVERMTKGVLSFLDQHDQKATFFALGWVAEHFPDLIREIVRHGHEIACHSYGHPLVYNLTESEFERDLAKALDCIEAASGTRTKIYRAPGFSITASCPWAFEIIRKHGIEIDSSVFPARRSHGGFPGAPSVPHLIETRAGTLLELPLASSTFFGLKFVFSGGGYFRIIPESMLCRLFGAASQRGEPVMTYFHPRDFYTDAPIPKVPPLRRFRAQVGLRKSYNKLARLLREGRFGTVAEYAGNVNRAQIQTYSPNYESRAK
jgi:peptidoglycan-N-acetylglucosamine deacetylase